MTASISPGPTTTSPSQSPILPTFLWRMQIPLTYALPLLIYSAVALRLGLLHREHINTDAVCYIRRAQYLLHGQWYYFISENWSLMISWLIAPLMALHIDGLYAARIVNGCIGGAFIVAFVSLAGRLLQIHWAWRLLAGAILAPFIAAVAMRAISPDLLLATWLMIYFQLVLDQKLLHRPRRQLLVGLVGGLAYLAKAFALPFVTAHLLLTLLMHASRDLRSDGDVAMTRPHLLRQVLIAWSRAMCILLLVIAPWVAAMSWKYHHLTIGSAGAAAHGMTGDDLPGITTLGAAIDAETTLPPGPYVWEYEAPEKLFPRWSPFQSRSNFNYQLRVIADNARDLRQYLSTMAPPHIMLILTSLALLMLAIRSPQRWKLLWLLLTLAIFLGPFLVVKLQWRYLNPVIVPFGLLLCMMLPLEWQRTRTPQPNPVHPAFPWLRAAAALLVLASFFWGGFAWIRPMWNTRAAPTFRILAKKIHNHGLSGPFACDSRNRAGFVAYFTQDKCVGFPATSDPAQADQKLHELGVHYLVVYNSRRGEEPPTCAPQVAKLPGWHLALTHGGASVYSYTPAPK